MHDNSAYCGAVQGPFAREIENILDGGKNPFSPKVLTVTVDKIDQLCICCGAPVEEILLQSGRTYDAEIFLHTEARVDLGRPHLCPETRRYALAQCHEESLSHEDLWGDPE